VFNVGNKMADRKNNWHEHLARVNPYRAARQAMAFNPVGRRDIGREEIGDAL
jgi:hypothetical protein